ncbi:MAG: 2-oxo acid dehydrogenase subunit E2 [Planctomycetales bacterium]|nr:2-oxo acid dehydrogenase subunit E2 [Planctomycetales bacterium]
MPHPITIPRLGWSMEEGVFGQWLKAPGELVRAGDVIFLLEGEKAAQEIEAIDSGYLCLPPDAPPPGTTVRVGETIGFLLEEGEPAPASVGNHNPQTTLQPPEPAAAASPVATPQERAPADTGSRGMVATPRAKRRAKELGVDWTQLTGTGRDGRIREQDVLAGMNARKDQRIVGDRETPPIEPGRFVPASRIRLALAQRMMAGSHQAAPVTLTTKVNADALVAYREQLKAEATSVIPTYNDILIHWAAQTLRELPELNACWHHEGVHVYDAIHIATAVDTPDGLLAPVLRHADQLSICEIAEQTRQLIAQARSGRLDLGQPGGTFTVSNLGMFGIDAFTPILNPPQAAILGVGRIVTEPVVRDGQLVVGKTICLSLTFDHRAVDGAPAARWLQRLSARISQLT